MKIEAVDFFYLSMPVVTDAGDGSQDALLVRIRAGGRFLQLPGRRVRLRREDVEEEDRGFVGERHQLDQHVD